MSVPFIDEALELGTAYELNQIAYSSILAELGGGYIQKDADAVLTIFPYTFWSNGLVSPHFTPDNVVKRIEQVLSVFRQHKREVWFHLGPSTSPPDLAIQLKSRGLWNFHNRPFMVSNLQNLSGEYKLPDGIWLGCLEDYGIFNTFAHPVHGKATTTRIRHIFDTFAKLDAQSPRKHWLFAALDKGVPVATATLYLDQGIAGIYDVEVNTQYRRRGIGSALLQTVCIFARSAGSHTAGLAASEQGLNFYPRFGFKCIGRFPTYYYSLKKQKLDAVNAGATW
jgi:ribosomal protein S18 acetylase RimI-like enzyme